MRVGQERRLSTQELMLLDYALENILESPLDCEIKPVRKSTPNIHWKDWCWSWSANILATLCEEHTHWKRPWCWEKLREGREGGNRGWDAWKALLDHGNEFEQTRGASEGQRSLVCFSPWEHKWLKMTNEWLKMK